MEKELLKKKLFEIELKIMALPPKERENKTHPFYKEFETVKRVYLRLLLNEKMKESEKDDRHKRK